MIDEIVVATSTDEKNEKLRVVVSQLGFKVFQGSETDVLSRFLGAAKFVNADVIVRVTGDCPLIDPLLVDECVKRFNAEKVDYLSNTQPPTFPDGLDTEVFSFQALERSANEATSSYEREHVTPFLRNDIGTRRGQVLSETDYSSSRWTVDEKADLTVVQNVFQFFAPRVDFGWLEVLDLERKRPDLFSANYGLIRNEGALMGSGQKLWKRAKSVIPGGGPKCFCLSNGRRTTASQKGVEFGIWTAMNSLICQSWVLVQTSSATETAKLTMRCEGLLTVGICRHSTAQKRFILRRS
jgi:glutamate-1-semialdehyde 2,1-aminomutase